MTWLKLTVGAVIAAVTLMGCGAISSYPVLYDPSVSPLHHASDAADIALAYLNAQTAEIAAPELHVPPTIDGVTVTTAGSASQFEPRIPQPAPSDDQRRVVWIVEVHGDLLNLHNYPWSENGAPGPLGNIVVDDATLEILGVYPREPNDPTPGPPVLLRVLVDDRFGQAHRA